MLNGHEKPSPVPEAATEEPPILTPEQVADRATRRLEEQENRIDPMYQNPDDPTRQPGVLSPPPEKRRQG
jgi:hypothetical protein